MFVSVQHDCECSFQLKFKGGKTSQYKIQQITVQISWQGLDPYSNENIYIQNTEKYWSPSFPKQKY